MASLVYLDCSVYYPVTPGEYKLLSPPGFIFHLEIDLSGCDRKVFDITVQWMPVIRTPDIRTCRL